MESSLFRSLTTSIRNNLVSLKRQSKRLHKASPRIFGQEYPLTVCQEAVAAAHGFPSWLQVGKLLARAGVDRDQPFWHQEARNDRHQQLLQSIYSLELSALPKDAVIVRGALNASLEIALCLWLEEMSARRCPGLLLIETSAETLQDTPVWAAVQSLGQNPLFDEFRVIDTRERRLPVAMIYPPSTWARAIECSLPIEMVPVAEKSWFRGFCELAMLVYAHRNRPYQSGTIRVDTHSLERASHLLKRPEMFQDDFLKLLSSFPGSNTSPDSFEVDMQLFLRDCPADVREELCKIMSSMVEVVSSEGVDQYHEALHRPTIVLFSRANPVSVALAAAMEIEASQRLCAGKIASPPIFYANCGEPGYLHQALLQFLAQRIIVDGIQSKTECSQDNYLYRKAHFAVAGENWVSFAGKRVQINT